MSSRCRMLAVGLAVGLTTELALAEDERPIGTAIPSGALLGVECAVLTQTALGVKTPWAYLGGAAIGAAAGGTGAYFVGSEADPEATDYLFAASIALVIPTLVWVSLAHEPNPRERTAPVVSPPRGSLRSAEAGLARRAFVPEMHATAWMVPIARGAF